jgi:hypothetical protein
LSAVEVEALEALDKMAHMLMDMNTLLVEVVVLVV